MKTIKDLAAGKVIARNNGTVAELIELMRLAFPKSSYVPNGNSQYYGKDTLTRKPNGWHGFNENPGNKPVQDVTDFLRPSEPWAPRQGERVHTDSKHHDKGLAQVTYVCQYNNGHLVKLEGHGFFYAKDVYPIPKTEVSLDEIAKWKKLPVHQIKIVP